MSSSRNDRNSGEINEFKEDLNPRSEAGSSTTKIISSKCRTEKVDGKFIKKCEKTEQLLRGSIGRPSEVVHSHTEYTEEQVTHEITSSSISIDQSSSFNFPVLRNLFEAAGGLFGLFGSPRQHQGDSSSNPKSSPSVPVEILLPEKSMSDDW